MSTTEHHSTCGGCGQALEPGTTICRHCGWDLTTSVAQPQKLSLLQMLTSAAWRALVLALVIGLPVAGLVRLRTTGPGPDLATTLGWMVLGDDGRSAELVTIHRAHEIGKAASRYAVRELEPPSFEGDWAEVLSPFSTMLVRGWMPMLFAAADHELSPDSVRELYRVRSVDGWGRPYRVTARDLAREGAWEEDEQVAEDLRLGLQKSFFAAGRPDFAESDWLRLELTSAGRDGQIGSGDDLRFVSYIPAGLTLHVQRRPADLQRQLDRAFIAGRQFFRLEGNRFDLIDARLLAEFRLEMAL
jgi:hypothetical protein